jgi:hypothetical protein
VTSGSMPKRWPIERFYTPAGLCRAAWKIFVGWCFDMVLLWRLLVRVLQIDRLSDRQTPHSPAVG